MSELAIPVISYTNNEAIINEVSPSDKDSRLVARDKIEKFEQSLKEVMDSDRGDMDAINDDGLKEHFIEDVYIRELFIPKDTAIVSRLWTKERFWVIASGEVTFTTEMGIQRVKAPYTKKVPPGSKVALYTHEDTLWFAVAGAKASDSMEAETELTANDYSECKYPWDMIGEVQ